MKKTTLSIALAAALFGSAAVQASEFDGGWIGGKVGSNRSDVTGTPAVNAKSSTTYGLEGGYNWNMGGFLLGVDGFVDLNNKTTHSVPVVNYGSDVYGLDAKLGLPAGNWLPYAKLGYANSRGTGGLTGSGNGAHLGLGIEYKFAPHWSATGEYTTHSAKSGTNKLNNNNFTVGINYYFDAPAAAPAPAPAPAPVAVKEAPKPAPVAAPAPAPVKETWKTLLEDKPVRIEGANFDTNSAKLRSSSFAKLDEVVEFAGKYKDAQLDVTGHTDNRGTKAYNQGLSERRAASVKAYLVKKGVAASRITTKGYGFEQPVADNKTAEGRAQNRRVEIRSVLKEEKKVRVTE